MDFIEDEVWKDVDGNNKSFTEITFEKCIFQNCIFTNTIFHKCLFVDCSFSSSDLSMSKWSETTIKNVQFEDSKLTGIDFSLKRNKLSRLSFKGCNLNYCIFSGLDMQKHEYINCSIRNADFTQSNLNNTSFLDCNLADARFFKTDLRKVNFTTATNFSIDPENNTLTKAVFSYTNVLNLLDKYDLIIE
jgi:fluoroquinolone resistance protein